MRTITPLEETVINNLKHPIYTVEYLEEWINRNDNVFINAPAALSAMGAMGFYEAVQLIVNKEVQSRLVLTTDHIFPDCHSAEHDVSGCLGYGKSDMDDEPCDYCKLCPELNINKEETLVHEDPIPCDEQCPNYHECKGV